MPHFSLLVLFKRPSSIMKFTLLWLLPFAAKVTLGRPAANAEGEEFLTFDSGDLAATKQCISSEV